MKQEVINFGRFYAAIRELSVVGDRQDMKEMLVLQYTQGRTDSLREMTLQEYESCCRDLEGKVRWKEELRRQRSATLLLMQQMGVDTTDWERINRLCLEPRIAGKEFYKIDIEEHLRLRKKLRAIRRKGGLGPRGAPAAENKGNQGDPRGRKAEVIILPAGAGGAQA